MSAFFPRRSQNSCPSTDESLRTKTQVKQKQPSTKRFKFSLSSFKKKNNSSSNRGISNSNSLSKRRVASKDEISLEELGNQIRQIINHKSFDQKITIKLLPILKNYPYLIGILHPANLENFADQDNLSIYLMHTIDQIIFMKDDLANTTLKSKSIGQIKQFILADRLAVNIIEIIPQFGSSLILRIKLRWALQFHHNLAIFPQATRFISQLRMIEGFIDELAEETKLFSFSDVVEKNTNLEKRKINLHDKSYFEKLLKDELPKVTKLQDELEETLKLTLPLSSTAEQALINQWQKDVEISIDSTEWIGTSFNELLDRLPKILSFMDKLLNAGAIADELLKSCSIAREPKAMAQLECLVQEGVHIDHLPELVLLTKLLADAVTPLFNLLVTLEADKLTLKLLNLEEANQSLWHLAYAINQAISDITSTSLVGDLAKKESTRLLNPVIKKAQSLTTKQAQDFKKAYDAEWRSHEANAKRLYQSIGKMIEENADRISVRFNVKQSLKELFKLLTASDTLHNLVAYISDEEKTDTLLIFLEEVMREVNLKKVMKNMEIDVPIDEDLKNQIRSADIIDRFLKRTTPPLTITQRLQRKFVRAKPSLKP